MRYFFIVVNVLIIVISCDRIERKPQFWEYQKTISLGDIQPIGIATDDQSLYLSDGDNNRVLKLSTEGVLLDEMGDFERPMHLGYATTSIATEKTKRLMLVEGLYVPEYGKDTITIVHGTHRSYLQLTDSLDAPAGISLLDEKIAIADFYNHRILFYNGDDWVSVGKEGKKKGELYYPTDVHLTEDKIFVADAYNNRGQVFDFTGRFLSLFGASENINAATGIFVSEENIYLTDFENDRILNYDHKYQLLQILEDSIHKPTDIIQIEDQLYSINYQTGELLKFKLSSHD